MARGDTPRTRPSQSPRPFAGGHAPGPPPRQSPPAAAGGHAPKQVRRGQAGLAPRGVASRAWAAPGARRRASSARSVGRGAVPCPVPPGAPRRRGTTPDPIPPIRPPARPAARLWRPLARACVRTPDFPKSTPPPGPGRGRRKFPASWLGRTRDSTTPARGGRREMGTCTRLRAAEMHGRFADAVQSSR